MNPFTKPNLKYKNLKKTPVKGCPCAYCYHHGHLNGEGSPPSHMWPGGVEEHNPENLFRIALAKSVPRAEFKRYVSKPGGYQLRWQGKSGLFYATGRELDRLDGHFVHVYKEKEGARGTEVAWMCLPLETMRRLPLAGIVLSQYMKLRCDEKGAWAIGNITVIDPDAVPVELQKCITRYASEHIRIFGLGK